jgi:hypothetical protein
MVSVLMVANGTTLLRHGMMAVRAADYRVTLYDTTHARDIRRSAPDLLVFAADTPRAACTLLAAVRGDEALRDLPVVIVGDAPEVFAPLPVALLPNTFLLSAPSDGAAVCEAVQHFYPVPYLHPVHGHAVA